MILLTPHWLEWLLCVCWGCMCTCFYIHEHAGIHVCTCIEVIHQVSFLSCFPPHFLKHGHSLNLQLIHSARVMNWASGNCLFFLFRQSWGYVHVTVVGFCMGPGLRTQVLRHAWQALYQLSLLLSLGIPSCTLMTHKTILLNILS